MASEKTQERKRKERLHETGSHVLSCFHPRGKKYPIQLSQMAVLFLGNQTRIFQKATGQQITLLLTYQTK